MKKILLLGSGELGKEFVISAQRKGPVSYTHLDVYKRQIVIYAVSFNA